MSMYIFSYVETPLLLLQYDFITVASCYQSRLQRWDICLKLFLLVLRVHILILLQVPVCVSNLQVVTYSFHILRFAAAPVV